MKLNLYNIIKGLLKEEIDTESVKDSIEDKYFVRIKYDDGKKDDKGFSKGSRVIRPMAIGTTKKGNRVLRAFQENGSSRRGAPKWKYFLLDRIESWMPMKNKHFYDIPSSNYGDYNLTGDRSMQDFWDNAKFDDMSDTLNQVRAKRKTNFPKVSTKNAQGPINAAQQWKKNVFTSFPNSEKYKDYAKNVEKSAFTLDKWADYEKAMQQANMQNQSDKPNSSNSGPITNNSYDNDDYYTDDVDYEDLDYFKDKNKNRF